MKTPVVSEEISLGKTSTFLLKFKHHILDELGNIVYDDKESYPFNGKEVQNLKNGGTYINSVMSGSFEWNMFEITRDDIQHVTEIEEVTTRYKFVEVD